MRTPHSCGCSKRRPCKTARRLFERDSFERLVEHLWANMIVIQFPTHAAARARDKIEIPLMTIEVKPKKKPAEKSTKQRVRLFG